MKMTIESVPEKAKAILQKAQTLRSNTSGLVITLAGDLGAGKTTLTQAIAKALGVTETIISPTFVIMKKYETTDSMFKNLIHIDAYRLTQSQELLVLGWKEICADPSNLIIIEWPELVPECIPENSFNIELKHVKDGEREIYF